MEHSRYLVSVEYQQRIDPNKLFLLCRKLKQTANLGLKCAVIPLTFTKAEISYITLYGYRVINRDWSSDYATEIAWN